LQGQSQHRYFNSQIDSLIKSILLSIGYPSGSRGGSIAFKSLGDHTHLVDGSAPTISLPLQNKKLCSMIAKSCANNSTKILLISSTSLQENPIIMQEEVACRQCFSPPIIRSSSFFKNGHCTRRVRSLGIPNPINNQKSTMLNQECSLFVPREIIKVTFIPAGFRCTVMKDPFRSWHRGAERTLRRRRGRRVGIRFPFRFQETKLVPEGDTTPPESFLSDSGNPDA
jgi:hypothetical protein